MTKKMQLCRIIYCFLTALHVSSAIFAHHQEHLNCNYSFWSYLRVSLSAAVMAEWKLTKSHINPLQTKRRPLYVKTQSVPRCKHFSSGL